MLEYNPLQDDNIVRAKDVFLAVDRIGKFRYMLNVVDGAQSTSYTRKELQNMSDFQFNNVEQGINFIGNPRKNHYIPGYLFKVRAAKDFGNLKAVVIRCMVEANNRLEVDKLEGYDEDYLGEQLEAEGAADATMKDIEDYDFAEKRTTQQRHDEEHRELQRLLSRLDASVIMEEPPSPKEQIAATSSSKHLVDK